MRRNTEKILWVLGKEWVKLRVYLDNCCYNRPYDDVVNREQFDYTKWHETAFDNKTLYEFIEDAAQYEEKHPFSGNAIVE